MKFLVGHAFSALFLGLSAAAAGQPRAPTIVVFGDSTTAPSEACPVYGTLLEAELTRRLGSPVTVINAGVKGSTTAGAAERFEHDVISHGPDLVVIQFGINDATIDVWKNPPATHSRVAFEQYDKNLREFVRVLKLRGVRVVLMTPNPLLWTTRLVELYGHPPYDVTNAQGLNVILIHYADAVRRVAVDSATPLIDVMAAHEERRQQSAEPLLLDGMHPNQRGHELVAALLADLIVNEKLLGPARP